MTAEQSTKQDDVFRDLPPDLLRDMYRRMLLIRKHEEHCLELKAEGRARGPLHLCVGQEAVGVGVCTALRKDDVASSTHRGHAHYLAKGADPKRLLAEILGRSTGYGKGKAGHMLIADVEVGLVAGTGIVGGFLTASTGQALAFQVKGSDRVAVCFFGDGASNTGAFHESLNIASLWKLPIVYVCDNNLYGLTVPLSEHSSTPRIATRAKAYDMPGVTVDGNDVLAVYQVALEAVARARNGRGPTLIEALTYRTVGFSTGDRGGYRSDEEVEEWRRRDPIPRFQARLKEYGILSDDQAASVEVDVVQELDEAAKFALDSPFPEASAILEDLWA
jgi:TPP-dependent pyruvate/acetoin dehydrogenase alpha subunit